LAEEEEEEEEGDEAEADNMESKAMAIILTPLL